MKLKSQRYNGKFVHNETVYQVLEAIKVTTPIDLSGVKRHNNHIQKTIDNITLKNPTACEKNKT